MFQWQQYFERDIENMGFSCFPCIQLLLIFRTFLHLQFLFSWRMFCKIIVFNYMRERQFGLMTLVPHDMIILRYLSQELLVCTNYISTKLSLFYTVLDILEMT